MQVFKSFVAFAAMALVAFLAGCSGGSQFSPATRMALAGPLTISQLNGSVVLHGPPAIGMARLGDLRFYRAGTGPRKTGKTAAYLFASDFTTGNINEFTEDNPRDPIGVCYACGGWGLAISPTLPTTNQLMAVGTSSGIVDVYDALSTGTPVKYNKKALTLSGGGDALGLCWDNKGGLWADNYGPTTTIDYFDATVVAAGGGPTRSITESTNVVEFFIACDWDALKKGEFVLLGYGYDNIGNVNVTNINPSNGSSTVVQTLGNTSARTGYPGGIAIDKKDDLVAINSYGTAYFFKGADKWLGKAAGDCTWITSLGLNWISITFDDTQKETWAGDIVASGYNTAVSAAFPYSKSGGPCAGGESGGPTNPIKGEDGGYLGVAVWPNSGV